MLFNSLNFLIFFPSVCFIYFLIPTIKGRNIFLLISSYYFYMNWEPTYAAVLFFSSLITYAIGKIISRISQNSETKKRKKLLCLGIVLNLGVLIFFKYFNFLGKIITYSLGVIHIEMTMPQIPYLLPVGISFFLFQEIGYMIDVFKQKVAPVSNFFDYALFVSFFPQLVAGPIERTSNLIPQFKIKHSIEYERMVKGIYWMLWGYFLKLVLADNCAVYVDAIFNNLDKHIGSSYFLAAFFFTFQVYGDLGGYSLIAIGAAKIMGFNLMENFRRPYFASSISEYWRRWHISLSTWLRDYIYFPLGGNRKGQKRKYLNLMTTFAISGLWHGADFTYILWGLYHGSLVVTEAHFRKKRPLKYPLIGILITFILVVISRFIYRAESMSQLLLIGQRMDTMFTVPYWFPSFTILPFIILIVMLKDYLDERYSWSEVLVTKSSWISLSIMTSLFFLILILGNLSGNSFIYFQF